MKKPNWEKSHDHSSIEPSTILNNEITTKIFLYIALKANNIKNLYNLPHSNSLISLYKKWLPQIVTNVRIKQKTRLVEMYKAIIGTSKFMRKQG